MAINKILIVDDDPIILIIHKKLLKKIDSIKEDQIYSWNSGAKCLGILSKDPALFEDALILLDINMPEMDGWQFMNALDNIKGLENVKVILVSSSVDLADRIRSESHNRVNGFIEKPMSIDQLQKHLKK